MPSTLPGTLRPCPELLVSPYDTRGHLAGPAWAQVALAPSSPGTWVSLPPPQPAGATTECVSFLSLCLPRRWGSRMAVGRGCCPTPVLSQGHPRPHLLISSGASVGREAGRAAHTQPAWQRPAREARVLWCASRVGGLLVPVGVCVPTCLRLNLQLCPGARPPSGPPPPGLKNGQRGQWRAVPPWGPRPCGLGGLAQLPALAEPGGAGDGHVCADCRCAGQSPPLTPWEELLPPDP